MNSLILSPALFRSVFSWSAPSSSAILTQELSMSMAVHRATLHRRHCTRVQCTPFSSCVTYPYSFQDAQKLSFSFVLLLGFWGQEGEAVRRNTCCLRASSCSRSFLNPSNKKNVLILCSNHLYPRPTKCITTFFSFKDLLSEWNFCFEPYLLDLMYFCL